MCNSANSSSRQIFFRDGRRLWINTWLSGLAISIIAFLLFQIGLVYIFRLFFYVFCFAAVLLFAIGSASMILNKIRILEIDDKDIFLYFGIPGFKEIIRLKWNDIRSISIEKRNLKTKHMGPLGFMTTMETPQEVLIIEINRLLSEEKRDLLRGLRRRLFTRGLVFEESKSEIWLKERPKGGFSSLLKALSLKGDISITEPCA
jgi:hypothetical protein